MSVKQKGDCFYPRCGTWVVGQRNTRKTKRTGHGLMAIATGGASLALTAANEMDAAGWMCANCGGPVYTRFTAQAKAAEFEQAAAALPVQPSNTPNQRSESPSQPSSSAGREQLARMERLKVLGELRDSGVLSAEEFASEKQRILENK